jgi:hypothetical protein
VLEIPERIPVENYWERLQVGKSRFHCRFRSFKRYPVHIIYYERIEQIDVRHPPLVCLVMDAGTKQHQIKTLHERLINLIHLFVRSGKHLNHQTQIGIRFVSILSNDYTVELEYVTQFAKMFRGTTILETILATNFQEL